MDITSHICTSDSKRLHNYIVNGEIENVKTFLNLEILQPPYLNEEGNSAAYVAIKHKRFEIYSLLLSHDIRFTSDDERKIINGISWSEQLKLNDALAFNFREIKNAAVHFLLSHTRLVGNKNKDKIKDIQKYYEELNKIPEIEIVFSVIKCSGFVDLIFDFEMDSIIDMDTTSFSNVKGKYLPKKGRIYIGAKRDDENSLKGTIAHELTHYAMQIVYSNCCKPHHYNDVDEKLKFQNIIDTIYLSHFKRNDLELELDTIVQFAFQCYDDSQWPEELIVRVNHMLAFHGLEIGEKLLISQTGMLLGFYRENVMPHCKNFIQNNYLLKPKSEIEILNLASGLVARIENSPIRFVYSLKMELDQFLRNPESPFLMISSSSTFLSAIKLFQSLSQLLLNLNQYIFIDYEVYLKQPNEIYRMQLCESCQLLVLKIPDSPETNLKLLLKHLTLLLSTKPKFKIIVVTHEFQVPTIAMQFEIQKCKHSSIIDVELDASNLTSKACDYILMKEIEFQGESIHLKKLINEKNRHLIDANVLNKLVSNEKIKIGGHFNSTEIYITRELKYTAIKDASNTELQVGLTSTSIINEINKTSLDAGLLKHKNPNKSLTEIELVELVANEKVVAIADCAGSGKTTLLTHIALLIKEKFKDLWIVRVNLNSFTPIFKYKLESNNQFSPNEAVEFLIKSLDSYNDGTENLNFNRSLFRNNIRKVVVMFDGFDEINPDFATTVQNLVHATIAANVKQIWLTTRPHCKAMIETEFQCKSFEIIELSEQNQFIYLVKFWKTHLEISEKDYELQSFAKKCQESIEEVVTNKTNFLENPLQLMMLAEALIGNCKEYLQFSHVNLNEPNAIRKLVKKSHLYEKFIKRKFKVYAGRQVENEAKTVFLMNFKTFIEIHQVLALKLYFSQSEVEMLLADCQIGQLQFDIKEIEAYGLITRFEGIQPEFVHLTFADYFISTFIANNLLGKQLSKEIAELLIASLFSKEAFQVVRSFINETLTSEIIAEISQTSAFVNALKTVLKSQQIAIMQKIAFEESNDKLVELLCACCDESELVDKVLVKSSEDGSSLLHLAASRSNEQLVRILIEDHKVDVNAVNKINATPLHMACLYGTKEIVNILIQNYNADLKAVDSANFTALHYAVEFNNKIICKMLVEDYGADVNAVNKYDETPLHSAAKKNSKEIIRLLIDEFGSNVNAVDNDGNTPLCNAAFDNSIDVVKMLIDNYKADTNGVNINSHTPLHYAVELNSKEVIKMLIDSGANVNAANGFGRTPLHIAAVENRKEIVQMLIDDYGADINAVDNYGMTLLHYAAEKNSSEVIKMLLEDYKVNVNTVDNDGNTPLHAAAASNSKEMIKMFIDDYGAHINAIDNVGRTLLHFAAKNKSIDVFKMLVDDYGTDVNAIDNVGSIPLHWAAKNRSIDVFKMLVDDYGADVNASDEDGNTALHWAAKYKNIKVVKTLIEDYGANVNASDDEGNTALHWAAENNSKEIVQMLIEEGGADVDTINHAGSTPLHMAAKYNNKEVIELLTKQ